MLRTMIFAAAFFFAGSAIAQDMPENEAPAEQPTEMAPEGEEAAAPEGAKEVLVAENKADESIDLNDGTRLVGTVKGVKPGKVVFETKDLGSLDLGIDVIDRVNTTKTFDVWYQLSRRGAQKKGTVAFGNGKPSFDDGAFKTDDFYRLDTEQYELWEHSGSISALMNLSSGNTEEFGYGIFGNLDIVNPEHEISAELSMVFRESNQVRTSERYYFRADYRYYFEEKWAAFARQEFESDKFKDLNLRATTTVGVSYDMYNEETKKLRFEAGFTYTREDLKRGVSEGFGGLYAGLSYFRQITDTSDVHFTSTINQNFEETKDFVWRNRARFNQILWEELTTSVVLEHDYDNKPSAGFDRNDFRLLVMVGWSF